MFLTAVGACIVLAVGACIVPLSPEFDELEANAAPAFLSLEPALGSVVNATPAAPPTFAVTVEDRNPNDTLYFRWLLNFFDENDPVTRLIGSDVLPPAGEGTNIRTPVSFTPSAAPTALSRTKAATN